MPTDESKHMHQTKAHLLFLSTLGGRREGGAAGHASPSSCAVEIPDTRESDSSRKVFPSTSILFVN